MDRVTLATNFQLQNCINDLDRKALEAPSTDMCEPFSGYYTHVQLRVTIVKDEAAISVL